MNPQEKEKLDAQARLHQMQINTRLASLQAAQTVMSTPGFRPDDGGNPMSRVDAITLISMACEIEKYILGEIEAETKLAIEEFNKPKTQILKPVGMRP